MKNRVLLTTYHYSLLLLLLVACSAPIPEPTERQLIFNFENKDEVGTDLPRVLVPGLEVEIIAGNGKEGYKDGPALEAEFAFPLGMALTEQGELLITDDRNSRIRKLGKDGNITTVAGSGAKGVSIGIAEQSELFSPSEIIPYKKNTFLVNAGSVFLFNELDKSVKIFASSEQVISFYKGENKIINDDALLVPYLPKCMVKDFDETLYFCMNRAIYRQNKHGEFEPFIGKPGGELTGPDGSVNIDDSFIHYQDGNREIALFSEDMSLAFKPNGDIYVADGLNHVIRKYNFQTEVVSTVAGHPIPGQALIATPLESGYRDGTLDQAEVYNPSGITYHKSGAVLFVSKGRLRLMSDTHISTLVDQVSFSYLELANAQTLYAGRRYVYRITLDMPTILAYLKEHPITFTSPEPPYQEFVESES